MKKKREQSNSSTIINTNNSSEVLIKKFEIFVTDFLTDPCGLPNELKNCVLVDGKNTDFSVSKETQACNKK
ncbi:unnamed protein product [Rotaria magnacalcarata]|uniref:Uncharacterized protein n=1 Tax=Rotaria magnacalcarata TaxID=392030 RepID=A0A816YZJ4_9BILA|nr:unnamed protein product [Rotaria magnacalcarata]CAF1659383.1 unnamed protein product [Rotaria magnacalcarata]CAF2177155.1 unnamed protein product [Rotaria magnacalcarata]